MEFARDIAGGFRPPAFFGQTNAVFPRDDTAPLQHLCEKLIECALDLFAHGRIAIVSVGHNVDVHIAIAGVTETSDWKSVFRLQFLREFDKIDNATARYDDVLI